MPGFLLTAVAMVCLALGFLVVPLLRAPRRGWRAPESVADGVIGIYRDQMKDLESDFASGALSGERRRESELELESRMLGDLSGAARTGDLAWRKSLKTALGMLALLPLVAGALYCKLGNPSAFLAPAESASAHSGGHATTSASIAAMVDALARKLEQYPDNPDGWALLPRSLAVLQRDAEALSAYENAVALAPADAALLADYADAIAMTQQGRLTGKPMQLVRLALRADPANPKALALAGTDAFDQRDYRQAAKLWEKALAGAPPGSEFTESLRASLDEALALAGEPKPAARSADVTRSAMAGQVSGRITVSAELNNSIPANGTLFIFARAETGPRMPVAILRRSVTELQNAFVLDDRTSMTPDLPISGFSKVIVSVRISTTGDATPAKGDLVGESQPVAVGTGDLNIEINRIVR